MTAAYRCLRCGERLSAHGSHAPSLFRCSDGAEVPWSAFRNGAGAEGVAIWADCTCGHPYEGHDVDGCFPACGCSDPGPAPRGTPPEVIR